MAGVIEEPCPTCGRPLDLARLPFGKRLRLLRDRRGWTQREAAAMIGVPQTTLSSLEARSEWPSESACRKLAAVYEVKLTELLGL